VELKVGSSSLTEKRKLDGRHWVYNITVANTHNYLVGTEGFLVHNDCGDLDVLATKFMQNFSPQLKKLQIAEWWAKGFPEFFTRGTFFEKLMAKSGRYSGWTHTSHNFKLIDFYKYVGGKLRVASMKTTNTVDVNKWISNNSDHLTKLSKGVIDDLQGKVAEYKELHVYMPKALLENPNIEKDWILKIKAKYPAISNIVISSIEKELNLL